MVSLALTGSGLTGCRACSGRLAPEQPSCSTVVHVAMSFSQRFHHAERLFAACCEYLTPSREMLTPGGQISSSRGASPRRYGITIDGDMVKWRQQGGEYDALHVVYESVFKVLLCTHGAATHGEGIPPPQSYGTSTPRSQHHPTPHHSHNITGTTTSILLQLLRKRKNIDEKNYNSRSLPQLLER